MMPPMFGVSNKAPTTTKSIDSGTSETCVIAREEEGDEEGMDGDWKIPLIIGCSVGGFLLILAILIVVIYLRRRSRLRKNQCYDSNLSSRDATVDSGYTTFSLQKPGMPPLPSSAQSHPHGGLWTTQAVSQAQQQWAQPTVPVEGKSQGDKKTSSSTSLAHKSTEDVHKQSNGFWKDRKSSHMHESTESMESTTGSSTGSYGSQSELILRDQKQPEVKSKSRDKKKSQRRSERLEPDMSVIEEESNPGSKVGQYKGLPSSNEPEVPQHQHQAVQVRHHQPDELEHPVAAAAPAAPAAAASTTTAAAAVVVSAPEVDSRRTIYPPPPSTPAAAALNVDAIIEIQPKPPASRTVSTSEDKRLILEAFSFLDEFDQQE